MAILTLVMAFLSFGPAYVFSQGLTYDLCSTSDDCEGTRHCATLPFPISKVCTNESMEVCLCQPKSFKNCKSSNDCGGGEACRVTADGNQICTSCTAPLAIVPIISVDNAENCNMKKKEQYSFERCSRNDQCIQPRQCFKNEWSFRLCNHEMGCVCKVPKMSCRSSKECLQGDRCVKFINPHSVEKKCVSCRLVAYREQYIPLDDGNSCVITKESPESTAMATPSMMLPSASPSVTSAPSLKATTSSSVSSTSLDKDTGTQSVTALPSISAKSSTSPSTGTAETITPSSIATPSKLSSQVPVTSPLPSSTRSLDMSLTPSSSQYLSPYPTQTEQKNNVASISPKKENRRSASPSASGQKNGQNTQSSDPSSEPEASAYYSFRPFPEQSVSQVPGKGAGFSCVSVKHLKELASTELVYMEHRRAGVLCDSDNNCATPGHMVVFKDRAMMMISYCKNLEGGCVHRTALVNSPSMKRNLRIASNSPKLHFTAYAAVVASRLEERFLGLLVDFGI